MSNFSVDTRNPAFTAISAMGNIAPRTTTRARDLPWRSATSIDCHKKGMPICAHKAVAGLFNGRRAKLIAHLKLYDFQKGARLLLYGFFGSVTTGSFSFSFSASTLKRL